MKDFNNEIEIDIIAPNKDYTNDMVIDVDYTEENKSKIEESKLKKILKKIFK